MAPHLSTRSSSTTSSTGTAPRGPAPGRPAGPRQQRLPVPAADHRPAALPTGPPSQENLHNYHGVQNTTLVKIEEASMAAYNKAIYLILLIGFLMLGSNV